jgi:arsenate reductase
MNTRKSVLNCYDEAAVRLTWGCNAFNWTGRGWKRVIKENSMTEKIVIYQKPTCSKCRATLALLKDSGEEFDSVNYYEVPLTPERLRELIDKLGVPARDVLRDDESLARELKLREQELSDDELIEIMVENPDLIQRPIVVRGDKAVLCRPPENVMKLL